MVARVAIISIAVVVIVVIAAVVGVFLSRRSERMQARQHGYAMRGDLNRSEEQALVTQLAEAEQILRNLGNNNPDNYGDPEILRADTRIAVGLWLKKYNNVKEKVSK
jgi:flagellar basal body-associated protein FliL